MLPDYTIQVFGPHDQLPAEAEELFARQLACSRQQPSSDQNGSWVFMLTCAVTAEEHVLGGVHLDLGPIGGAGPLAKERLAYLERTFVRLEYRRQGLATKLLRQAIRAAADAGCQYIRCSANWDNLPETALFLKCGFALVDIDGENDPEPCYMAVRSLQNLA
ncbi:MAG TPA: GNAT family N-acetyltransferase [Phycisphaerae bacterium]|nr:GNAT family N-acetyltransferase [Phycisphaerae bacterium]HRY71154.1 GNAT family N-acetyltransferase [Phycisphaerae bacterium]